LRLLISSLDSFILLETEFSFIERLLVRQDYYSNGIIDENALVRNHIIASKYLFGGFTERLQTCTDVESGSYVVYSRQQFENASLITEPVISLCFDKDVATMPKDGDSQLDSIKVSSYF
jgi:hypothetical protein